MAQIDPCVSSLKDANQKYEEGWFDEGDEQTTDMSQLSPAFREIFNEYSDEEEDDDNA